jgi:hypothetical protein
VTVKKWRGNETKPSSDRSEGSFLKNRKSHTHRGREPQKGGSNRIRSEHIRPGTRYSATGLGLRCFTEQPTIRTLPASATDVGGSASSAVFATRRFVVSHSHRVAGRGFRDCFDQSTDSSIGSRLHRSENIRLSGARFESHKLGRFLIARCAPVTGLKRYQVCDRRDDDPKCHCARHHHCYFRSRMDIVLDKLTALRRSKSGQPLVIP